MNTTVQHLFAMAMLVLRSKQYVLGGNLLGDTFPYLLINYWAGVARSVLIRPCSFAQDE